VDGDDVRMLECSGNANLGLKAPNSELAGERWMEQLDRDGSFESEILGAIHGAHATVSELFFEPIAIGQRVFERAELAYHVPSSSLKVHQADVDDMAGSASRP
jgi:hypothetical protein